MNKELKIILSQLLPSYLEQVPSLLASRFSELRDAEISSGSFSFYTSVSSVFSSKIEGEQIELDSYIKHKKFGVQFAPDYTKKIDDLYSAYTFAQQNPMNRENIAMAHKLLSRHLLALQHQGIFRHQQMFVTTPDGKIEYVAADPFSVKPAMEQFFHDLDLLLEKEMVPAEVFFYAAMIHLVFVKIHPWNDGNGRSARLLEKWFLASKMGEKAWFVQSEKIYYQKHQEYYHNIRLLGLEYDTLDYTKALPFLLMLPSAVVLADL